MPQNERDYPVKAARGRDEEPRLDRFGGRHAQFYAGTLKAFIDDAFH